ncbi:hypothetical protein NLU13_2313 [Sarocladium strictum]|uniref:Uncharacterized protein n=1 Tax=Sarocladium strictum TaxID=5046 RepID=A0AA39GU46_SARSR|nr:hypothetical protein NLU13_2313 [Sarocladium strictum]
MRRSSALLFALGGASPAAAWLKYPFLNSAAEQSWTPPKETAIADAGYDDWTQGQVAIGWSPRPTEAPKPLFGRILQPRLDEYTLGPKTCGFIESDANSITCITDGATCTFSDNNVGCCEPNKDCSLIKTTCIDYDAVLQGACNLPDDFHTLCCGTSSLGACFTWVLSTTGSVDDDDDHHTFTLLDCAPTSGTAVILDYDPSWSSTHIFSSKDTTTTTNSGDSSSTTDGADPATSSSSGSSGGSGPNVGAIAGGTVGGVVVLALIGLGAFFFLRRRKGKDSASPASTSAHMSQYGPVPTGPSGPTSPGSIVVYPSGVSSNFQGYPPPGQYDPSMQYHNNNVGHGGPQPQPYGAYGSPSPGYGQSGSPDFAQQQQQQQGGYGGQYSYQPSSMGSPPPLTGTSPSPGVGVTSENPLHDGANNRHAPSELAAVNPIGSENNRAELG